MIKLNNKLFIGQYMFHNFSSNSDKNAEVKSYFIDLARHYLEIPQIITLLNAICLFGYNSVRLLLSDDESIRIS